MSKKMPGLPPERASLQERVQDLHAIYVRFEAYRKSEMIVFHWTEEFSWLPKLIRPLLRQHRSLMGPHPVMVLKRNEAGEPRILMVSDDREGGDPVGAVALYDEKTKEYHAFDFERGNSADFHTVKRAVLPALHEAQEWKEIPKVLSAAEWSERKKKKHLRDNPDTPH